VDAQRQYVEQTIERCLRVVFTRSTYAFVECASKLMATDFGAIIQRDTTIISDLLPSVCAVSHTKGANGQMRALAGWHGER
jgi:hypothetical protein